MRELIVSANDSGQRLDKYLFKYFKEAPSSFVYKMLRKKNIVLNSKKSDGREIIQSGDIIKCFLAEDTFDLFGASSENSQNYHYNNDYYKQMPQIVYEDENFLFVNKPAGMLSQKDEKDSISFNEIGLSYLYKKGEINDDSLKTFIPSICNRLDRNTSGILIFAKNYNSAKFMAKLLKDRTVHKYYRCILLGELKEDITIKTLLSKDSENNRVIIERTADGQANTYTQVYPVSCNGEFTCAEVLLVTGKTHQIRAHMAYLNHPILGDYKYGNRSINDKYKKKYGIKSQLLCSVRLEFPEINGKFSYLSNKVFKIDEPNIFEKVMQ